MNDTIKQYVGLTMENVKFVMAHHPLWEVEFIKKDGSTRTMIATRDWKFLEENADEMDYTKPSNPATWDASEKEYVRVWDCNELGWRVIPTGERLVRLEQID